MKKQFLYVCLAIAGFLTCGGCTDFLTSDNPSAITDQYYNTLDGQQRLLTDMYSKYRTVYGTGQLQYYGTDMYMAVTESPDEKMFGGYDKSFNSTAGVVGSYWSTLYKIVQEGNTLLNRCTPGIAGDQYASITAQGRFLRVLAYYYLVETFGPVPLLTEENTGVIEHAERTPEKDIYAFMVSELGDIVDVLPDRPAESGRLCNAAVLQLQGKVLLTRAYKEFAEPGDFEAAAKCFDRIIDDPEQNFHLLESYADVFAEENQGNAEVIWAIQYGTDKNYLGSGNSQHLLFGFNIVALRPDLFDKVQKDYSAMQRGYWIIPQVHEWFTDPVLDARYDATFKREFYVNNAASEHYGELGLYFPRWNDDSGDDKGALECYPYKDGDTYNWYPNSTALTILQSGSDFMPIVQKFKESNIDWGGAGTREDIVMRVGDTYLLSAEAWLGAGDATKALLRINDLRMRAASDASRREEMKLDAVDLDVILDERGRELLGEHDRWFDLKRTGKLIERAYRYNPFVSYYDNLNENHLVRPIPQDERNKVDGLTQNEGY